MLDVSCLMIDAGFNTLMNLPYHIYFSLFVSNLLSVLEGFG